MPLNGLTISEGATCSVAGGSVKTFSANAASVKGGIQIVDTSVTDARVRPSITAVARPSAYDVKNGTWTYEKRDIVLVRPKLLSNGTVAFNSIRTIVGFHPETTVAEVNELYNSGSQLNFDTDTANFRSIGTIA